MVSMIRKAVFSIPHLVSVLAVFSHLQLQSFRILWPCQQHSASLPATAAVLQLSIIWNQHLPINRGKVILCPIILNSTGRDFWQGCRSCPKDYLSKRVGKQHTVDRPTQHLAPQQRALQQHLTYVFKIMQHNVIECTATS